MTSGIPFVSVIIPTYRDWNSLSQSLRSLAAQTYSTDCFEILVVNNDPRDFPPADFQLPINATLIEEEIPGSYSARNAGIKQSRGEILVFTDADCLPNPEWLKSGINRILSDNVARLAGNVELYCPEGGSSACYLYEKVFSFDQKGHAKRGTAVTANMFARREVFEVVGSFNPHSFSGEDTQWGLRAQAAGFLIGYSAEATVKHPSRTRLQNLARKSKRTYGGWYRIKKYDASLGKKILSCFIAARPPIRQLAILAQSKKVPTSKKIKVLCVLLYLRSVRFAEHLRLTFGRPPERE